MVQTNNSEVVRELQSATKIQTMQGIPTQINNSIVPTIEVNPKLVKEAINVTTSSAVSGSATILANTVNTGRDVYVTAATLGYVKNVTCDIATGIISIIYVQNGASRALLSLPVLTLTADNGNITCSFPHPIKIDRNTSITMNGTFSAGAMIRCGGLSYFIDDCSNG